MKVSFFKIVFASIVGLFLFFGLTFGSLMLIGLASGGDKMTLKDESILKLKLNQEIVEIAPENPFGGDLPFPTEVPLFGNLAGKLSLIDIKKAIRNAAQDEKIKGIFLEMSSIPVGSAMLSEIRQELEAFKATGKFIVAHGDMIEEKAYFLASVADEVYLSPQGFLEFNGLTSERMYYKNALDRLGIKVNVFKVGTFKSAVEPYLRNSMSEADREQTASYLNSLHDFYIKHISKSRNIPAAELNAIAKEMRVQRPGDAVKYKLVDDTLYVDQAYNKLRGKLGKEVGEDEEENKLHFVSLSKYKKYIKQSPSVKEEYSSNKIAVIIGQGAIVDGKGQDDEIGGDVIAEAIRKARKDEKVKAIVLRVNSPGGSALASDIMWREVQLAKKEKPVIACMSDLAASGGYYMSMGTDYIIAHPNTITGSIGIFGLTFEAHEALNDKIGITFDRVNTGDLADMGMPTKPFSEAEKAFFQKNVDEGYKNFTSKAASGRKLPLDSLLKIAEGRVWTGEQALKLGLVDELGDLDDAIAKAAKESGLEEGDYMVSYRPKQKTPFDFLMENMQAQLKENALKEELGPLYPHVRYLREVRKMQGVQARLPYELVIK